MEQGGSEDSQIFRNEVHALENERFSQTYADRELDQELDHLLHGLDLNLHLLILMGVLRIRILDSSEAV